MNNDDYYETDKKSKDVQLLTMLENFKYEYFDFGQVYIKKWR